MPDTAFSVQLSNGRNVDFYGQIFTLSDAIQCGNQSAHNYALQGDSVAVSILEYCWHCDGTGKVPKLRGKGEKPCPDCKKRKRELVKIEFTLQPLCNAPECPETHSGPETAVVSPDPVPVDPGASCDVPAGFYYVTFESLSLSPGVEVYSRDESGRDWSTDIAETFRFVSELDAETLAAELSADDSESDPGDTFRVYKMSAEFGPIRSFERTSKEDTFHDVRLSGLLAEFKPENRESFLKLRESVKAAPSRVLEAFQCPWKWEPTTEKSVSDFLAFIQDSRETDWNTQSYRESIACYGIEIRGPWMDSVDGLLFGDDLHNNTGHIPGYINGKPVAFILRNGVCDFTYAIPGDIVADWKQAVYLTRGKWHPVELLEKVRRVSAWHRDDCILIGNAGGNAFYGSPGTTVGEKINRKSSADVRYVNDSLSHWDEWCDLIDDAGRMYRLDGSRFVESGGVPAEMT